MLHSGPQKWRGKTRHLAKSSLEQLSRVKAPQWQINCADKCAGRPLHPAEMDLMMRRSRRLHLKQLTWRRLNKVCVYVPTSFKFTIIFFPIMYQIKATVKGQKKSKGEQKSEISVRLHYGLFHRWNLWLIIENTRHMTSLSPSDLLSQPPDLGFKVNPLKLRLLREEERKRDSHSESTCKWEGQEGHGRKTQRW